MIRAFVGIPMPEETADRLAAVQAGLPTGRAVAPEGLHLTLAFLGEQPEPVVEDVHLALGDIRTGPAALVLEGLGMFGGATPRSLHAVVRPDPALSALRKQVQRAAREAGVDLPREKFVPHVTLARFRQGMAPEDLALLHRYVAARMGAVSGRVPVTEFTLYRSHLTSEGAAYEALAEYPLG
jgi:2'-5' RNA ligase